MAKLRLTNIDPLKAPNIMLRSGMTPVELIELWESHHMQYLYACEWMDHLYEEYVYGRTPHE